MDLACPGRMNFRPGHRIAWLLTTSFAVFGCSAGDASTRDDDATKQVYPKGSLEARAVVAVANDYDLDADALTALAGVPKGAANAIAAARLGPDGEEGTDDDLRFSTLAEVDELRGVGASSIRALYEVARMRGYAPGQSTVDVVFSPQPKTRTHTARVARLIDTAESHVDIAMYSYSEAGVADAIERAIARGVAVRFVFETAREDQRIDDAAEFAKSKSGSLTDAGVRVRYVNKIMHHKFVIVDGPRSADDDASFARVASGSANWSGGAGTVYDENTVFASGQPELALRVQHEFDHMWEHSRAIPHTSEPERAEAAPNLGESLERDADLDVLLTSDNFDVKATTFRSSGKSVVSDAIAEAIRGATKSIHVASGHLRSYPIAQALIEKATESPDLDIRIYTDGQEYISDSGSESEQKKIEECVAELKNPESELAKCYARGIHFGKDVGDSPAQVRYKYYAYRWHFSYAPQMHHKFLIVDGEALYTGSYNYSENAEQDTFENVLVFRGERYKPLIDKFEATFESLWQTGRASEPPPVFSRVETESPTPLVFDSTALDWSEVTSLKALVRDKCPAVNSKSYYAIATPPARCPSR